MSRRTFADMDAELVLRLANREDITQAMRGHFLMDAYRAVANRFTHPELQVPNAGVMVEAGGNVGTLPTDCDIVELVTNNTGTGNRVLSLSSKEIIEAAAPPPTGQPTSYYLGSNQVILDKYAPVGNVSLGLWYQRIPAELADTESPAIKEIFDLPIIMLATVIGLQTVRDYAQSQVAEVEYNNYLAGMRLSVYENRKVKPTSGFRVRK